MPLSDRIRKLAEKFSSPPPGLSDQQRRPALPPRRAPAPNTSYQHTLADPVPAQQRGSSSSPLRPWSASDPRAILGSRVAPNSYQVKRDLIDGRLACKPVPTNAWWQNLIVEQGDQPVVPTPYMVKCLDSAVVVCAPTPLVQETYVASIWHDDWRVHIDGCSRHRVVSFDSLSVIVEYTGEPAVARVPLVRGAAFITVVFCTPTHLSMSTVHAVIGVDGSSGPGTAVVRLNSGTTWLVCCDSPVELQQSGVSGLTSSSPVVGAVRLALLNSECPQALSALLLAKDTIPVGGAIDVATGDDDVAVFTIDWETQGSGPSDRLLMCALPHHQSSLTNASWADNIGKYWTSMGQVRGVHGSQWKWIEAIEPLGFSGQNELSAEDKAVLRELVQVDANTLPEDCAVLPPDPYFFGKAVARAMRIALIADEVGDAASCNKAVERAISWLAPWLEGTNPDYLVYDEEWKGVVSTRGLVDPGADFGQGRYNDHHFHYGYFIYAAAALAKLRPDWLAEGQQRREAIDLLVRDYCNPSTHSHDDDDVYFPFMRCFDFYEGHSIASGLFAFGDSRNQESTSEAINAYYAAYLYAMATGRPCIARFVRAILQLEARSSRIYWHLGDLALDIYPETYARGRAVVGILWSSKADFATFFGANPEFIYGIQFLPYTPAMSLLLKRQWVADIWPQFLEHVADNSATESWREIINLAYAVVDKQATKDRISKVTEHDDGNSASNSYYWIATA
ncbi:hypothetical protein GGF42_000696 [Coemansia sp. RSA 2424]|nr:hypothetical protein GGF42_000696 [Coemansia sp. RSA 2424]